MDDVFKALSDPIRRALLDALFIRNAQTMTELLEGRDVAKYKVTRQAVAKHLAVLEHSNLITIVWKGREKYHYLNPVPIQQIADRWIGKFEKGRVEALTKLKSQLEEKKTKL